jgi:hypothetical protein
MALDEPAANECPQLEHETSSVRESKRRPRRRRFDQSGD